jgi:hypothetical protein
MAGWQHPDGPVAVTGVALERDGDSLLVKLTTAGDDVVVIDAFDPYVPDQSPPHSVGVTAAGIREAVRRHPARPART